MERDLGPLEQIERAVQERAKDISLEMAGAGKDMQSAGEKIEEKAEDCRDAEC